MTCREQFEKYYEQYDLNIGDYLVEYDTYHTPTVQLDYEIFKKGYVSAKTEVIEHLQKEIIVNPMKPYQIQYNHGWETLIKEVVEL